MLGLPFDPNAEFNQWEHHRPHWAQTGTIVFVTFRTHDSIPRSVIATWDRMKIEWLRRHGILANNWRTAISLLRDNQRAEFQREFHRLKEICLDESLGACPLKQPELATVVSGSLLHFDGQRYQMGDFVVMPNHVHMLAAFPSSEAMKKQIASWLRFTATEINRILGRTGPLWQEEPFDHLVRHAEQYNRLRKYIATNPDKGGLRPGEYLHYQRPD